MTSILIGILVVFITICSAFQQLKSRQTYYRKFSLKAVATSDTKLWTPSSWRNYPVLQAANYPDEVN